MQTLIVHMKNNFNQVFVARMIEWEHAVLLMLFGWALVESPDLFDTAASYASFKSLYPNYSFWALSMITVGGLRFVVLVVNGTIKRSPHLRAVFAALTAFYWFHASYGAVVSGKLTPLTAFCVAFFGWQFVVMVICAKLAKLEDIKAIPRVRTDH